MTTISPRTRTRRQAVGAVAGVLLVFGLCLQVAVSAPAQAAGGTAGSAGSAAAAAPPWCQFFGTCPTSSTTSTIATTTTARPTTTTAAPTTTTTAPTTTTTEPPSGDGPCGGVGTKARSDGGTWTCSFYDEFSGTSLDRTKWLPQTTDGSGFSSGTQDCFMDSPNNVGVTNGNLVLTSRRESGYFTCKTTAWSWYYTNVTSGSVSTYGGRFSQTYGRFEARMRVTGAKVTGLHEAFWLWPDNPTKYGSWPSSGEIDVAEIYHQYPDRAIPFVHYNNANDPNVTNNYCTIDDISKFHTYVVEWTPTSIKVLYDGQLCIEDRWVPASPQTGRQPFDSPFIVALTQGLGQNSNDYTDATPLPASTVVDYVRVYK
jgi:beta-glucanase (GH16 family)